MFVTVKINSDLPVGTFVCHDADNVWRSATSADQAPLGLLTRSTELDDEGVRWGQVTLAGTGWARAGAAVPVHGGWLACDDQGRAIVGSTEDCGLVAPLSRGAVAPNVDDLVMVYLR